MIEILNEETQKQKDDTATMLPRNIRQIGDTRDDIKVYIEDYVMTYMKQLAAYDSQQDEVMILYGSRMEVDGTCYYFINGSVKVDEVHSPLHNTLISQEDWKQINEDAAKFFPSLTHLGWALLGKDSEHSAGYRVKATHDEFFGEERPVFIEYIKSDREEKVYLYQNGMMRLQGGHYIYYDKNEPMQNYMIDQKEVARQADDEHLDHATRQFRLVAQEKKEKRKKQRVNLLVYATSMILAVVVILTGITLLNNYEKMESMEKVLFRIADGTSGEETSEVALQSLDEQLGQGDARKDLADLTDTDSTQTADGQAPADGIVETASMMDGQQASQNAGSSDTGAKQDQQEEAPLPAQAQTKAEEIGTNGEEGQTTEPSETSANDRKEETQNTADAGNGENAVAQTAKEQTDTEDGKAKSAKDEPDAAEPAAASAEGKDQAGESTEPSNQDTADAGEQTAQNVETRPESDSAKLAEASEVKESEPSGVVQNAETAAQPEYQTYLIQKGDTLQKINYAFYGKQNRIAEICQINHIENQDSIRYGVNILLPQ